MAEVECLAQAEGSVAVVIPLYNGAKHIAETLTSVQHQTIRPPDVIVVDDGSTDQSREIVREHPVGARLIEQSHLGVAVARNRGLAEVNARWVAFLDQDDLWHPTRVERLLAWLRDHPDERIVATTEVAFSTTEESEQLTATDPLVGQWASHLVPEATAYAALCVDVEVGGSDTLECIDHRGMLRGPITVTTSFIADPQLLRLAGGFAPHALAMDDYWLLVNVARLQPIVKVDQPTVLYRVHLGATSRSTRLALPFLSSAVALRLGGGLISSGDGLERDTTGPLHEHLLDELLRSPAYGDPRVRRAAHHLSSLLWHDKARALAKAEVRRKASWLVPVIRRVRRRLGGSR